MPATVLVIRNSPMMNVAAYTLRVVNAATASGIVVVRAAMTRPAARNRGTSAQLSRRYSSGSSALIVRPTRRTTWPAYMNATLTAKNAAQRPRT